MPKNRIVEANEEILEQYENYYDVIVLIKSKDGNVLNKDDLLEMLKIEKNVNESLNAKCFSVADIISIIFLINENKNITYENKIRIMEEKSNDDIQSLLHFILKLMPSNYLALFLSKDFDGKKAEATLIKISLNGSLIFNEKEALKEEKEIANLIYSSNLKSIDASVLGGETIENDIMEANKESVLMLLPISFLLIIIVLWMTYKSMYEILISLLVLFLSIIWVYGIAAILNFSLNPISASLPILIVGMGIDYSIHLILRMKERRDVTAVYSALFLSTITTAIGFLSNTVSSIPLLQQFGFLASFGILSCYILTISLIPFFNKIKKFKEEKKGKFSFPGIEKKFNKEIVIFSVIILTTSMLFLSFHLSTRYDIKDFLPPKLKIARDARYFISSFNFSTSEVDVLIKGNVTSPSFLFQIKKSIDNINDDDYVIKIGGKASVDSVISLMHDFATNDSFFDLNYNKSFSLLYDKYMYNDLPRKNTTWKDIKILYDWIYKHGGKYVLHKNNEYDGALLRINANVHGSEEATKKLYDEIKKDVNLRGYNYIITGPTIVAYVVMKSFEKSQINSTILALFLSFFVMEIIFRRKFKSYMLGVITAIPVILTVIWILGTMALLHISLTVTTITVTSLAIGMGIDYSIHVTNEYMMNGKNAVKNVGVALMASAATTILAFVLLSFSLLPPIKIFGFLISISIFYSFIASIFILPIFLEFFYH